MVQEVDQERETVWRDRARAAYEAMEETDRRRLYYWAKSLLRPREKVNRRYTSWHLSRLAGVTQEELNGAALAIGLNYQIVEDTAYNPNAHFTIETLD